MDRTNENEKTTRSEERLASKIKASISASFASRRENTGALIFDIFSTLIGFFFARCHIVFGAHPLAIGFIAALPSRVWLTLIGAVVGGLTLGQSGIIYAMISVIVVFLRIIVSGTDKEREDGSITKLFCESLLLKMSSALIGGFVAAVYEILLSGFTLASVLFGLCMIFLPPLLTFAFSGFFDAGIGYSEIFKDTKATFSLSHRAEREKYNIIFFQASALLLAFFVSLSLKEYELLGINAAYIFSSMLTLFAARRFGPLRAAAAGFFASLGLSGPHAAAFALVGVSSGVLFSVGLVYALIGGAICLSAWCAYSGGLPSLLATLPEYAISAAICTPLLKKLSAQKSEEQTESLEKQASEMVGTMALSFKSERNSSVDALTLSLCSLSYSLKRHAKQSVKTTEEELYFLVKECIGKYAPIEEWTLEGEEGRAVYSHISKLLLSNGRISQSDLSAFPSFSLFADGICETVNRAAALLSEEKYRTAAKDKTPEELDLISKLIDEARAVDERERAMDEDLSLRLGKIISELGMSDGVARAFGDRQKHIIIAAEDEDGKKISSPLLKEQIEADAKIKLSPAEFYRRGKMALLKCSAEKMYRAESKSAGISGTRDTVSGDSSISFETKSGFFYSLISDGMGSGKEAKETSLLTCDILSNLLDFASSTETVMRLLNHLLLSRGAECSATVDLFSFDLYTGEASFIKSGAAVSYIKRQRATRDSSSLFRIRSRTAPLGLMQDVDAEKIKIELESDDYIIMFSDGICQSSEDAPWLVELLSLPPKRTLEEYASFLLSEAQKNVTPTDDMTVSVTKIERV